MIITRPIESEKALMSICFNYPDKAEEVAELFEPGAFSEAGRKVFAAIKDILSKQGEPTVLNVMDSVDDAGAKVYASEVNGVFAPPTQIEFHAQKMNDYITRIKLRDIYAALPEIISDRANNTDEMISALESQLISLQKSKFKGYITGREIALKTVKAMELARTDDLDYPMSGLATLDATLKGFRPGKLYIVGARPGMGKTALVVTMMAHMNKAGHKVGFFSAEMDDVSISFRYLAVDANQPIEKVESGRLNNPIMASMDSLSKNENLFVNDTPNISLTALIRDAKTMKRKENVGIIFVDYISLIKSGDSKTARHERVGLVSKRLKQLARELEIPVVALSQLTRDTQAQRPTIASIRYSGEIEEDADCIMLLHAEKESASDMQDIECIIAKNRGGVVGNAKLRFRKAMTKFFSESVD